MKQLCDAGPYSIVRTVDVGPTRCNAISTAVAPT